MQERLPSRAECGKLRLHADISVVDTAESCWSTTTIRRRGLAMLIFQQRGSEREQALLVIARAPSLDACGSSLSSNSDSDRPHKDGPAAWTPIPQARCCRPLETDQALTWSARSNMEVGIVRMSTARLQGHHKM